MGVGQRWQSRSHYTLNPAGLAGHFWERISDFYRRINDFCRRFIHLCLRRGHFRQRLGHFSAGTRRLSRVICGGKTAVFSELWYTIHVL